MECFLISRLILTWGYCKGSPKLREVRTNILTEGRKKTQIFIIISKDWNIFSGISYPISVLSQLLHAGLSSQPRAFIRHWNLRNTRSHTHWHYHHLDVNPLVDLSVCSPKREETAAEQKEKKNLFIRQLTLLLGFGVADNREQPNWGAGTKGIKKLNIGNRLSRAGSCLQKGTEMAPPPSGTTGPSEILRINPEHSCTLIP